MEEEWRDIPGYEGLYKVSSLGTVIQEERIIEYPDKRKNRNTPRKVKKLSIHNQKYWKVTLTNSEKVSRQVTVHRLMAWAFFGPQEKGIEVRHLDGDGFNNVLSNLAYGTKSENMRDAITHRSFSMSDWHPCAKLTRDQVEYIKKSNKYYKDIAKEFNIHPHTIHKIRRLEIRRHD